MSQSTHKTRRRKLQYTLYLLIFVSWVLPLLATTFWFSLKQEESAQVRMEEAVVSTMESTITALEGQLRVAIDDSRQASYDSILDAAHQAYTATGDQVALYATTSSYLKSQYSYNELFNGALVQYWLVEDLYVYAPRRNMTAQNAYAQKVVQDARNHLQSIAQSLDTGIAFYQVGDTLYLIRNLVDSSFVPYATLILPFQTDMLLSNWESLLWARTASFAVDDATLPSFGEHLPLTQEALVYNSQTSEFSMALTRTVEDHTLHLEATFPSSLLQEERSTLYQMLATIVVLSGIILTGLVFYFYRNITKPMEILLEGTAQLEQGNLGYQIDSMPRGLEFYQLSARFNLFSQRLQAQFERHTQEQQALTDARIKALQSQINPHFLNNTLEMINWQARIAGDDTISQMISSLSTMLNAAMARGGSPTVTMKEEFSYVEAYLYIISHRFGKRLQVSIEVDPSVWSALVPRLILQPIVENAIEHGVALQAQGRIDLRIYPERDCIIIDCDHAGTISPADRATIDRLLQWDGHDSTTQGAARIGIRNVQHRLKMVCGERSNLSIVEQPAGHVHSRIIIPYHAQELGENS